MIARLLGGFIAIIIGVMLMKPITEVVQQVQNNMTNDSSVFATTILSLTPGFFAMVILVMGITTVWGALRDALGGEELNYEDEEPDEPEPKPKTKPRKQTYEEYVDERLKIERKLN